LSTRSKDISAYFCERFVRDTAFDDSYKEKYKDEIKKGLLFAKESSIETFRFFLERTYQEMLKNVPKDVETEEMEETP
jgi:hypothetical protein